jgi:[ribosomal protein S5]-alanine N-acetyltransferase
MFRLEGEKSYLVPFEDKHINDDNYMNWLRDYEVVKSINRLDYICPIDFDSVKEYCTNVIKSQNDIFLAIYFKEEDRFIGTIRINNINWYTRVADIGILIGDKNYWGKGIAKDSIFAVSKYLLETLGIRKLTAGLMDINPAMQKVFEKLGFKVEGIMRKTDRFEGKYIDHIYMGCFQEEFNINFNKK